MIVIIDYGMGNLRSVSKALESLGASVCVSSDPADLAQADKVILPGVGAFGAAMRELRSRGLIDPLTRAIASGKPYLGICLGLQLLFDSSEESREMAGLGLLRGVVKRFVFSPPSMPDMHPQHSNISAGSGSAFGEEHRTLKIPHMGWNQVTRRQQECAVLNGVADRSFVYFVHSYYADPTDRSVIALESDYGGPFTAMVWRDNVYATQFHPEKSQSVGLRLLKNFINL